MQLRSTRLTAYGRGRTAWTPAQISTALWLDAADSSTVTLNGSTVSQWNDKSGNGRNAVQATAANQPGWGRAQNLFAYSEELNQSSWSKVAATINVDTIIAPDGTLTADKVEETATTNFHMARGPTWTFANNTQYTISGYFKAGERTLIQLAALVGGVGGSDVYLNLSNGTLTNQGGTGWVTNGSSVESVGNGWYRASLTFTTTTGGSGFIDYRLAPSVGTLSYAGTAGFGAYMWGLQIVIGPLQPYQKTTSAAQTLSTGLNGKATMAWPDVLNNRFMETSASFATQDVFVVARYRDGTQSSWLAAYQGVFGGAGTGSYIGLIGDSPDKWYTFCDFGQLRRNGGAAQLLNTSVTALPLPPALLNANRPAGAITASFCVGNDRTLALNRAWSGIMGEIIVLSSIASTETRQRIEGYLAWKWGGF